MQCQQGKPCGKGEAVLATSAYDASRRALVQYSEMYDVLTMACQANLNVLVMGGGAASGPSDYSGGIYYKGGGGSGHVNVTNLTIDHDQTLNVFVGRGGRIFGGTTDIHGSPSYLEDEDSNELIRAEGARGSYWTGGTGFSGGGAGSRNRGGWGGSNGEDGQASDAYEGGKGSHQTVEELNKLFNLFKLSAGDGGMYTDDFGGGGGGILVEGFNTRLSRGSTGEGYGAGGSYNNGLSGVVLLEVV